MSGVEPLHSDGKPWPPCETCGRGMYLGKDYTGGFIPYDHMRYSLDDNGKLILELACDESWADMVKRVDTPKAVRLAELEFKFAQDRQRV